MYKYDFIKQEYDLPIKSVIETVDHEEFHIHNILEVILVLKGSLTVVMDGRDYLLEEDDFMLISPGQLHSLRSTADDNIVLSFYLGLEFFREFFPSVGRVRLDCNSLDQLEDPNRHLHNDYIRYVGAKIVLELSNLRPGSKFKVFSLIYELANHIWVNYPYEILSSEETKDASSDLARVSRIVNYISSDIKDISLKEIAEKEHISYHYLSRFIKENMGMTFQDFLNLKRLNRAVVLLLKTDDSITNIALESGFSNNNSFNKAFKEHYDFSPSEYRKMMKEPDYIYNMDQTDQTSFQKIDLMKGRYLEVKNQRGYEKLFRYLDLVESKELKKDFVGVNIINLDIEADLDYSHTRTNKTWKKMISFGRGKDALDSNFQEQLRELQREIGFKYIAFYGIFDRGLLRIHQDLRGNYHYNWNYIDSLLDFFMDIGIKPSINLSFMPDELSSSLDPKFWWKANTGQPKTIEAWTDLVHQFMAHIINRYGLEEVKSWRFEIWKDADFEGVFWKGSKEDFFEFYKESFKTIKALDPDIQVGGPSISYGIGPAKDWLIDFLDYTKKEGLELDFISLHIYPEAFMSKDDLHELMMADQSKSFDPRTVSKFRKEPSYYSQDYFRRILLDIKQTLGPRTSPHTKINISEWNASCFNISLINDTSFVANYILDVVSNSTGLCNALSYWNVSDLSEGHVLESQEFSGCPGLMTRNGIKKPSYYSYFFLNKLGDQLIERGDNYIVTKSQEGLEILLYNHASLKDFYSKLDLDSLKKEEKYLLYEDQKANEFRIRLEGLEGHYHVQEYMVNRNQGSAFDNWVKMGARQNMGQEEIDYLKSISRPDMKSYEISLEKSWEKNIQVPLHGIHFIKINKIRV